MCQERWMKNVRSPTKYGKVLQKILGLMTTTKTMWSAVWIRTTSDYNFQESCRYLQEINVFFSGNYTLMNGQH